MQGVDRTNGKRLSDTPHLRQSITDILTTPIGTRVFVRDYGSDLYKLVDNPQDESSRVRIVAATAKALGRWEPRLQITSIVVSYIEAGVFDLTIVGVNRETQRHTEIAGVTINGY